MEKSIIDKSIKNTRPIWKKDSDKMRNDFQSQIDNIKIERGDFVKAPFYDGKMCEHMWIQVLQVQKNKITGFLGNMPFTLNNVKFGDKVIINIKDVEDYKKG